MSSRRSPRASVLLLLPLLAAGCASKAPARMAQPETAGSARAVRDSHEDLHAVLWMQTAAEYQALTVAIYAHAAEVLEHALHDQTWTAALEQTGAYQSLPPAVILDLDETVLDNSAFQGQLVRDRRAYTEEAWTEWVRTRRAGAVPGALAFVHVAEQRGIAIVFISNRAAADEDSTIGNLHALGIETTGDALLSPGEHGWVADKSARRAFAAARYRVLMVIGDDLETS